MKNYKAFVTDREDGHRFILERKYPNKKMFLEDIRGNGYACADYYCKEAELFDWVIDEAGYYGDRDSHYAIWHFTKIPENEQEYREMMDKGRKAYNNRKIQQIGYRARKNTAPAVKFK